MKGNYNPLGIHQAGSYHSEQECQAKINSAFILMADYKRAALVGEPPWMLRHRKESAAALVREAVAAMDAFARCTLGDEHPIRVVEEQRTLQCSKVGAGVLAQARRLVEVIDGVSMPKVAAVLVLLLCLALVMGTSPMGIAAIWAVTNL